MQGPLYPVKITLVSTWYEDGIDANDNPGTQRFSHLVIPTSINVLLVLHFGYLLGRFFDTSIDIVY